MDKFLHKILKMHKKLKNRLDFRRCLCCSEPNNREKVQKTQKEARNKHKSKARSAGTSPAPSPAPSPTPPETSFDLTSPLSLSSSPSSSSLISPNNETFHTLPHPTTTNNNTNNTHKKSHNNKNKGKESIKSASTKTQRHPPRIPIRSISAPSVIPGTQILIHYESEPDTEDEEMGEEKNVCT